MKRYIRHNNNVYSASVTSSRYVCREDVIFDDVIRIDIDVALPFNLAITSSQDISKFPGVEQFRDDILHILENEYHFEVIEDIYDGILQKGHISNRSNSTSIYFDTYYDLSNAEDSLHRLGISNISNIPSGTVYCFIHLRLSDHSLEDVGDVFHNDYINQNEAKYVSANPNVNFSIKDEEVLIDESQLHLYYESALEELRDDLDTRIAGWVMKAIRKFNL